MILDTDALRVLVGTVTVLFALVAGFRWAIRNERLASAPVGLACGPLAGSRRGTYLYRGVSSGCVHSHFASSARFFVLIGHRKSVLCGPSGEEKSGCRGRRGCFSLVAELVRVAFRV